MARRAELGFWLGAEAPGIRQGGVLGDALPFYRLANPANLGGLSAGTLDCASASRRNAFCGKSGAGCLRVRGTRSRATISGPGAEAALENRGQMPTDGSLESHQPGCHGQTTPGMMHPTTHNLTRPCRAWHKRARGTGPSRRLTRQYSTSPLFVRLRCLELCSGAEALHNRPGSPGLITFTDQGGTEAFAIDIFRDSRQAVGTTSGRIGDDRC